MNSIFSDVKSYAKEHPYISSCSFGLALLVVALVSWRNHAVKWIRNHFGKADQVANVILAQPPSSETRNLTNQFILVSSSPLLGKIPLPSLSKRENRPLSPDDTSETRNLTDQFALGSSSPLSSKETSSIPVPVSFKGNPFCLDKELSNPTPISSPTSRPLFGNYEIETDEKELPNPTPISSPTSRPLFGNYEIETDEKELPNPTPISSPRNLNFSGNYEPETDQSETDEIEPEEIPFITCTTPWEELWDILERKTENFENENSDRMLSFNSVNERFSDIHCPSTTAIYVDTDQREYVHGNHVVYANENSFGIEIIATQSPMKVEEAIFWKLVFSKNILNIIDLTTDKDIGDRLTDANRYYPDLGERNDYEAIAVACSSQKERLFTYDISDGSQTKQINRYHFTEWKDVTATSLPLLIDLVAQLETYKQSIETDEEPNKVIIHCRAGVGRTGTLTAAFLLKDKINKGEITPENLNESLVNIILQLRERRGPICVQTREQFKLLCDFGRHLLSEKEKES